MATNVESMWEERVNQRQRDRRFVNALWKEHRPLLKARKAALPKPTRPIPLDVVRLMRNVAKAFGLTLDDITCRSRNTYNVDARATVILLLRRQKWSSPEIAHFVQRDHSSVLHALYQMDVYWKRNPLVAETVERLEQ